MINPFHYGGIVGEDAFCNRKQELADLGRAAENGDRTLVYAERRMGKTSLIRRVLARLPKKTFLPIYVDLWATSDAASFARTVAKATTEAAATRADKMLETGKELFRHLIPSLTLDEGGNPSVQFGARSGIEAEPQIEEALDAPALLAKKRGLRVVMVYDEIQRIGEYGNDTVERMLRSRIQTHSGVAYFFLGSRRHLIQRMFMEQRRPLYHAAGHYPLSAITTEHWIPFIDERFSAGEKPIPESLIIALCERTEGHPYYTQHLAHDLWEISPAGTPVTEVTLKAAEDLLLSRLAYTYTVLWESLTTNQQVILRGLAAEPPPARPFAAAFLHQHRLAGSSAHRAVEGLLERDLIDREGDGYILSDRFLRLWLRRI